ncbi:MAG TPA: valine--tRNA ligase [Candidatus Nanoarchaeia archaeon]|nr:valine--tRNA ligase [Candidatus Nanoarchaeia archaeon]
MENYVSKEAEKKWQEYWEKNKIFEYKKGKKPVYSIDTPPPYVSADHLHLGHAMSYSQAEFIARYKRMKGFNVFYPMGFDDNGLPTERFVEKKYNIDKSKISRKEFIQLCLKETKEGIKTYKKLWTSLGISVDWNENYSTIDKKCQKISQKSFIDLYKKKRVERREEPIMWCNKCQTALAQADLEDLEKNSFLNEINFESEDGKKLTISTSRPELIPACVALFVNKNDKRYKNLIGKRAKVPLMDYSVPIIGDDKVDMEFGTGLMMVCTFGDIEDIERWKTHKMHTRVIIDKNGMTNSLAGKYKGMHIDKVRKEILNELKEKGLLVNQKQIKHVTNVHERCSTPIEFIITPQWYIKILDIKKELVEFANKINWYPRHMKVRYDHWVNNLKWDWCISRERFYGVPFPVWYCKKCKEVVLPEEKDLPVEPIQDKPKKKCKCGSSEFNPETDVMDTWMTSSVTPLINSDWTERKEIYPMDLRPQAHDIIRTWAFYTIVKSYTHTKSIPWKDIMISGHGLDVKGQKISKSKGNFILAEDIINKYSADALRYYAASIKLGEDSPYQEKEVLTGHKTVNKLWNSSKLVLVNLKNYKLEKVKLEVMDRWLLSKLNQVIHKATVEFDNYEYSKAKFETEMFFWKIFCDNYLEISKKRLYEGEKSAKYTLYTGLKTILKLFAPLMPFITEEIYNEKFAKDEKLKSIHISSWPEHDDKQLDKQAEEIGDRFVEILNEVRRFKAKSQVSMKAEVNLILLKEDEAKLKSVMEDLKAVTYAKKISYGKELFISL